MNILQVCNKVPYPPHDGGSVAILNMAKSFAAHGHQVTILAMSTSKHNFSVTDIPESLTQIIKFIFVKIDTRIRPLRLVWNFLFSSLPYIAVRFINKRFEEALSVLISQNHYDIVQLEGLYLMPYIKTIRKHSKSTISYRAHNIENEIWHRISDNTKSRLKKIFLKRMAQRLMLYEHEIINKYDLLVPISEDDLQTFNRMGNTKPSFLCLTGIEEHGFKNDTVASDPKQLFYIGSLDWIPNQESLLWFLENVWHDARKRYPDLQFHIAGRNAPGWLVKKFSDHKVSFHGEVEDADIFMDAYAVMAVPLFAGSGLRIKIVEAMARSKAVITTDIGAQGLYAGDSEIIIANTAEDFIQAIDRLIQNRILLAGIQKNACTFARRNFNNNLIIQNLLYFYSQHA